MGRGTPCPMPPANVEVIRARVIELRTLNRDIYSIALSLQDLWPGCQGNHVRGLLAGLCSGRQGGFRQTSEGRSYRAPRAEPWRPGDPKANKR